MWRGPVVAEGQTLFPEQRLEGSMMGWPPVLNKHDPPTKCWSKHYNVICGPRCEPQETCGSALFNNTQILIFFWYKKSKLLSESLKSRNYSAIEFSQLEINADWARIWFWWQNWKCVILLFSPAGSKYGFGGVQRQIFVLPTSQSYFASQHCSNIFCSYFHFQLLLKKRPQLSFLSRPLDNNGEPSSIWPEHKTHQRWGGHLKRPLVALHRIELGDHEWMLWHRGFWLKKGKSGLLSCRTLAHL